MPIDLQIDIRKLKPDGWAVEGSILLKMTESGLSLREVMEVILDDELRKRAKTPPILQGEASLSEALDLGGTQVPSGGQSQHPPPLSKLLSRVEQSLRDGLILIILNGEPWNAWETPQLLPNPSSLWIARTVWLQHCTWS